MTIDGFQQLYLETHDWDKSVAFWQALGFKLEFETDHHSGSFVAPNGTRLFLAEQPLEDPVGMDVYLGAAGTDTVGTEPPVEVVQPFTATHWGTQVMTIRDPDGRRFRIEAPLEADPG